MEGGVDHDPHCGTEERHGGQVADQSHVSDWGLDTLLAQLSHSSANAAKRVTGRASAGE